MRQTTPVKSTWKPLSPLRLLWRTEVSGPAAFAAQQSSQTKRKPKKRLSLTPPYVSRDPQSIIFSFRICLSPQPRLTSNPLFHLPCAHSML